MRLNRHTATRLAGSALAVGLLMTTATGCGSDAQMGAVVGAGIGALAGQAIGGNTEATLIGTAVGLGSGYIIGNESDKQRYHSRDRYYYGRRCNDGW